MQTVKLNLVVVLLVSCCAAQEDGQPKSVLEGIQNGLQMAGKMFGINTAADVADLVASTFSKRMFNSPKSGGFVGNSVGNGGLFGTTNENRQDQDGYESQTANYNQQNEAYDFQDGHKPSSLLQHEEFDKRPLSQETFPGGQQLPNPSGPGQQVPSMGMLSNMLRIFGFDSGKLGAMAINGLIFIAQMIAQAFTKRNLNFNLHQNTRRSVDNVLSVDWILNNPSESLVELLEQVRDKNLPQKLVHLVSQFERSDGDADCIKVMLCKSSPFIWSMQKAIFTEPKDNTTIDGSRVNSFFKNLPELDDYKDHGDGCESRYKGCPTKL